MARQSGVYEQRVLRVESAVPAVHVPEYVEYRVYTTHSVEELRTSLMMFRAGSLVEDSVGWAVGHENVGIIGDSRV